MRSKDTTDDGMERWHVGGGGNVVGMGNVWDITFAWLLSLIVWSRQRIILTFDSVCT